MSAGAFRLTHEGRVVSLGLLAGLPGVVVALGFTWTHELAAKVEWTVTAVVLACWLGLSWLLHAHVVRALHTITSLLAAIREGDFSIRGRSDGGRDALGCALAEVNILGETLRRQRLGAVEATALLRTVMHKIDVAVFAFDAKGRLQLINHAGEKLLGKGEAELVGRRAEDLSLCDLLAGETPRTLDATFPGATGQWELRRSAIRQDGHPHELVVLTDLRRALQAEERLAWQRLIRVLSHEINNSLAPIRSIAVNLHDLVTRAALPPDWQDDLRSGLTVVARRSAALSRFLESYARLARLPPPRQQPVDVGAWVRRVVALEKRARVTLVPGPDSCILADGDQLDQLLINLVQNAVDAVSGTAGQVQVEWTARDGWLEVRVKDEGPGITDTANLFVPFFTTKPQGSGIGLAIARQIAEAHGGRLTLQNRQDRLGCIARLCLPVAGPSPPEHATSATQGPPC